MTQMDRYLTDGTKAISVAGAGFAPASLPDGGVAKLSLDDNGDLVTGGADVWVGGTGNGQHCENWTDDGDVSTGAVAGTTTWDGPGTKKVCVNPKHVICFEQ